MNEKMLKYICSVEINDEEIEYDSSVDTLNFNDITSFSFMGIPVEDFERIINVGEKKFIAEVSYNDYSEGMYGKYSVIPDNYIEYILPKRSRER